MCGIVAYTGKRRAFPLLYEGLQKLEYRGYDSAGICTLFKGKFLLEKRSGRVENLAPCLNGEGFCGIGHTRWATHGEANERNAHPHVYKRFSIVHNGVIENYAALKADLQKRGHLFYSDTDSEVIAHLLEEGYEGDFLSAVKRSVCLLKGSFALCILCASEEGKIVCVRQKSPLLIGTLSDGWCAASDLPAVNGESVYSLSDGEIALLEKGGASLYDFSLRKKPFSLEKNTLIKRAHEKGSFKHYTLKEIYETPQALKDTAEKFDWQMAEGLTLSLPRFNRVEIIGCGTAYHSALSGSLLLEEKWRMPVFSRLSGEFSFRPLLPNKKTLVIAVSQSGETADTILAAKYALSKGATLAVVTNSAHSSLACLADWLFLTHAGTEAAVAATKTYEAQLAVFYLLSECLSRRGVEFFRTFDKIFFAILSLLPRIKVVAKEIAKAKCVWFIGRGADYPSALEGSLKMREITYLSGAGYESAELKHGSLALVDEDSVVISLSTQKALRQKSETATCEVASRGARVIAVTPFRDCPIAEKWLLPCVAQKYYPLVSQIPLQLLAYYTALERGIDPDRPRNLAKSVTVE